MGAFVRMSHPANKVQRSGFRISFRTMKVQLLHHIHDLQFKISHSVCCKGVFAYAVLVDKRFNLVGIRNPLHFDLDTRLSRT